MAVFNIEVYGFQASRSKDISLEKIPQEPFSHLTSRKSVQSSLSDSGSQTQWLYFLEPESHAWIHRLVTGHICFTCRSAPNLRTLSQMTPTPVRVTPCTGSRGTPWTECIMAQGRKLLESVVSLIVIGERVKKKNQKLAGIRIYRVSVNKYTVSKGITNGRYP